MNKSFVDCSKCLMDGSVQKVCITDCENNLKKVETIIVTSIPEQQELVKNNITISNYLITSIILCKGSIESKRKKVADLCYKNLIETIRITGCRNLKMIGKTCEDFYNKYKSDYKIEYIPEFEYGDKKEVSSKAEQLSLDIANDIVIDLREFENVPKNSSSTSVSFEEKPKEVIQKVQEGNVGEDYKFKIPDQFYTDNYRLVDIQYITWKNQVIYIFRDKDNKKVIYEYPKKDVDYYWYESNDTKLIEKKENLRLVLGNYKERVMTENTYEGDIIPDVKHAVDYYLQNKNEPVRTKSNALFFDIEIYTYQQDQFPEPEKCEFPVNAISFNFDGKLHMYLLKIDKEIDPTINKLLEEGKYPITVFNGEITMIEAFIDFIKKNDPDFLCGWNISGFDLPYLYFRSKKLGIDFKRLSPYGNVYFDSKSKRSILSGYIILDQLKLYKDLTYITESSYSLENISKKVLGEGKEKYEGKLNRIYNVDIEKFIKYSLKDTELLERLENTLNHIVLQDELRKAASTTHNSALSTIGLADGLFLYSMKSKGLAARNAKHDNQKEKLPGAYVFEPSGGLRSGLLGDFDFTSLYPSIINSWNLGPNSFFLKIPSDIAFQYLYDKENLKQTNPKFKIIEDPIHSGKEKEIQLDELETIIQNNHATINITGCLFKGHDLEESIYYPIIKELFTNRKKFKNMMFDFKQKDDKINTIIYDGKQMALKILMNSLYGVLGNEHFRFYNNNLAASITLAGQELLKYSTVHCNRLLNDDTGIDTDFMRTVESPMKYVVYGDTDSMFVDFTEHLKRKNLPLKNCKETDEEIKRIQDYLNKDLLKGFAINHNIPLDKSMLMLKNEYLFSKYYTLQAKKKYAFKVIAQEGRELSFTEIKGLEIKRSDIPEYSRKMLTTILDMIFSDNFNLRTIEDFVEQEKLKVFDMAKKGDLSVAKTVTYQKEEEDYKNFPQHIRGMEMWNSLVKDDFRHGSKGKLYEVSGIDLSKAPQEVKDNYEHKFSKRFKTEKLTAVVIPEYLDRLPEYFVPNVKRIVNFVVAERVDLMLEPLMKRVDDIIRF